MEIVNKPEMTEAEAFERFPCVHRVPTSQMHKCRPCRGSRVHTICECRLLNRECTVQKSDAKGKDRKPVETCLTCELRQEAPVKKRQWTPSTSRYLWDSKGRPVELGGLYRGATAFLVCGGPSLNQMDLSGLASRGALVAAVNQVAATHIRPQLWFSVDDPVKFHESIWRDPGILCFTKRKYLRHATLNSARSRGPKTQDLPAVLGYDHRSEWPCDFLAGAPTWGKSGVFKSVFVVALRILADLGVSRICLLGADFHMEPGKSYAFDQEKSHAAAESNNRYYAHMNRDLPAVRRELLSIGCEVVNCTPGSHLTAFPASNLTDELERVTITPPASVAGLY